MKADIPAASILVPIDKHFFDVLYKSAQLAYTERNYTLSRFWIFPNLALITVDLTHDNDPRWIIHTSMWKRAPFIILQSQ